MFISPRAMIFSFRPRKILSLSEAVLCDVILMSTIQLHIVSSTGKQREGSQVLPSLISRLCSKPLPTLSTIEFSASLSQVSGTQSLSASVISAGKVNDGKIA